MRRPHGEDRRRAAGGRRPMQRLVQALLDRPTTRLLTTAASRKRTSALAGWTLTSTSLGIALDEQGRDRMPVGGQEIEVGPAQRARERLVAHRPPIDEQELLGGVRPAEGRQADPAGEPRAVASRVEPDRIQAEVVAERLAQPLSEALLRRRPAAGQSNDEPMSVANEKRACGAAIASRLTASAAASASDRSDLRNLSRAGVAAKRSRASTRAPTGAAQGSIDALSPVLDHEPQARRRALPRGCGFRAATPRRSRAAPRRGSRRSDRGQVAVGNFRRRVPLDAQREIGFVHAAPVVDDADQPSPAGFDRDLDRLRPGVERVLDQFLDRRRRPLDHLARGDAVDDERIETANRHGGADLARCYRIKKAPGTNRRKRIHAIRVNFDVSPSAGQAELARIEAIEAPIFVVTWADIPVDNLVQSTRGIDATHDAT